MKFLLDDFLVVEQDQNSCSPYRLVLQSNKDNFVVITRGGKTDCEVVRNGMISILERIIKMKEFS